MKYVLLSLVLLFSGCAVLAPNNPVKSDKTPLKITNSEADQNSIVKLDQRVMYMVRTDYNNGNHTENWKAFDCDIGTVHTLYWDLIEKNGKTMRFYGNTLQIYAKPEPYNPVPNVEVSKKINQLMLKVVCQFKKPEMHLVKYAGPDEHGNQNYVDINNSYRQGDLLYTRLGYDYAEISYDPPYDAPYGLKIEDHIFNCKTQQDAMVAGFDISPELYISDAKVEAKRQFSPVSSFMHNDLLTLCAVKDFSTFKNQGEWVNKDKKVSKLMGAIHPDFGDNKPDILQKYPLPPVLAQQIDVLLQPAMARPEFKRISFIEQLSGHEKDPLKITIDRNLDGSLRVLESYSSILRFQAQRIYLYNMIQLKSFISLSTAPSVIQSLQTDFRLPLSAGQHFSYQLMLKDLAVNNRPMSKGSTQCEVGNTALPAANINAAFSGNYLSVVCDERFDEKNKYSHNTYAWIEDLQIFLRLDSISDTGKSTANKYLDVRIEK